ncbi:MAG: hypothetical protein EXX96DRAFT_596547 [Benjaminiella poitrasii]|nr:MAG: hypothetical protein EXX96DRAFT_596547 [Benjaminiella poitrasii]
MDPILVKLLLCFKALVETLPSNTQQKKVKEHELCSRYLQPFFQSLFDSNEDDAMLFKWMNTITFSCNSDGDQPAATNNRPDGCIENDRKTIGYVEVKTIDYATNHYKINVDLHRLGIFGKTALSRYSLNKTFQVMAIGTNLQFYICQNVDGVCIMTELNSLRLPISLDELPQLVPYFDRLYNIVETIYNNCYSKDNMLTTTDTDGNNGTLEPKILKAITEKTVDRMRYNCFYHPYH